MHGKQIVSEKDRRKIGIRLMDLGLVDSEKNRRKMGITLINLVSDDS